MVNPTPRLSQASPSTGGKKRPIGSKSIPPSSPPSTPPSSPLTTTLGSRNAIPWPMPAGIAATAQAAPRPIMRIRKAMPVGHLVGLWIPHELDGDADHDPEDDPGDEDRHHAPEQSDPQADRRADQRPAAGCGT